MRRIYFIISICIVIVSGCQQNSELLLQPIEEDIVEEVEEAIKIDESELVDDEKYTNVKYLEDNSAYLNLKVKLEQQIIFDISTISAGIFERINGLSYKENQHIALDDLRYLRVGHYDLHGNPQQGELMVHKAIAEDMLDIFYHLYVEKYPIEQMHLVDDFGADDDESMVANNTSAFNYRLVAGSNKLSNHAYGLAIDINPLINPYVTSYGIFPPEGMAYADRGLAYPGMIIRGDVCYNAFVDKGFNWGGDWSNSKDYQHFDIKIEGVNK